MLVCWGSIKIFFDSCKIMCLWVMTSCSFVRGMFLGAFAKLRNATIDFVMSVRPSVRPPAWNNSAATGRIFMKFFENLSRKFKFHSNLTGITRTLRKDQCTFLCSINSFRKSCRLWYNVEKYSRAGQTTDDMRIGCCVPRAENTRWGRVMLIAFPLQEWFDERAAVLNYTYIAVLLVIKLYITES